jgi:ferredoxin
VLITTDTEACMASGQCAMAVPEVFDQDETTGVVRLLTERPPAHLEEAVRTAVRNCPMAALAVADS